MNGKFRDDVSKFVFDSILHSKSIDLSIFLTHTQRKMYLFHIVLIFKFINSISKNDILYLHISQGNWMMKTCFDFYNLYKI